MKHLFFSALCGCALAQFSVAATSNPVGYTTQTMHDGVFNLVGITLHGATVSTGAISSVSGTVVTVPDGVADGLGSGPYIFEVTSGTDAGAIDLIASSDGTADTLTLASSGLANLAETDTFVIREAATLGSIFGTGDDVIINKGGASTGDLIYLPTSGGQFETYYHTADDPFFGPGSWTKIGGGGLGADTPLLYTNGLYVLNRSGSNYDLVITGEVKTTPSLVGLPEAFNYISAIYPVGVTLDSSGIADSAGFVKGGASTGDLVYIVSSVDPSLLRTFYHTADDPFFGPGQWTEVGVSGDAGSVVLSSGILIQRKSSSAYNVDVGVPASWQLN